MALATINFFESNLELLNQEDYQKIVLVNLFTPEVLKTQWEREPVFQDKLIQFLNDSLSYHSRDKKISPGRIFTFELAYFLLKYLKEAPPIKKP